MSELLHTTITPESLAIPTVQSFIGGSFDLPRVLPPPTGPFSAVYAFGDSLSDAGNAYIGTHGAEPVSPPYSDGRFSNGPVWVQDLATRFGLGQLAPSLAGGTDFAFGGAQSGTTGLHTANATDLPAQLAAFKAADPAPQADALYTLSAGSDDLFAALPVAQSNPLAAFVAVNTAVGNIDNFVSGLAADGAKNLVVLNVPDLGKIPALTSEGPTAAATASAFAKLFDVELSASLRSIAAVDHLHLDIVDTYSLLDGAIAHPSDFGLSNVTDPVWTGNYTDPASGTLRATGAAQNQFLFWDQVHPTAGGHALLANAVGQSLGVV